MNNPPNLSTWHKVPDGATVPAGTQVFADDPANEHGELYTAIKDIKASTDWNYVYYTEKPIPDPKETEVEERAERMYRAVHPSMDFAWEYTTPEVRVRWIELAKEYKPC